MKSIKFLVATAALVMLTMVSCTNKPELGTNQGSNVVDSTKAVDSLTYDSVVTSYKSDTIIMSESK